MVDKNLENKTIGHIMQVLRFCFVYDNNSGAVVQDSKSIEYRRLNILC